MPSSPPFLSSLSLAATVITSTSILAIFLAIYLRFRTIPHPQFKRTHVRLLVTMLVFSLGFHGIQMVKLLAPGLGCVVTSLVGYWIEWVMVGIGICQAVNLHRVFLLQRFQTTNTVEKWYFATVGLAATLAVGSVGIGMVSTPSLDWKTHMCTPLEATTGIPPLLGVWNVVTLFSEFLGLVYITGVVALVSIVTNLAELDLQSRKTRNELRKLTTSYKQSRKASNMMVSEEEINEKSTKMAGTWLEKVSVVAGRMEDDATLAKVRHIAVYPTFLALVFVAPRMITKVLSYIKMDPAGVHTALDVINIVSSFVGLGLFILWVMDPTLWTVMAAERDAIAKRYVEEARLALDRNESLSFSTRLRRAWEDIVWLRQIDVAKAEDEARRTFYLSGTDPNLPLESVDTGTEEEDTLNEPVTPQTPTKTVPSGISHLRRGSTKQIQLQRKASVANTPIGMRRPSVAPAHGSSRMSSGSMLPPMILEASDEEEDVPSGLGVSLADRRPSARPPLAGNAPPGFQAAVPHPKSPMPAFVQRRGSVKGPGGGRRGSLDGEMVDLNSDGEDDQERDSAGNSGVEDLDPLSPHAMNSAKNGGGRTEREERQDDVELGLRPKERIRRASDAL